MSPLCANTSLQLLLPLANMPIRVNNVLHFCCMQSAPNFNQSSLLTLFSHMHAIHLYSPNMVDMHDDPKIVVDRFKSELFGDEIGGLALQLQLYLTGAVRGCMACCRRYLLLSFFIKPDVY